ncbi:hypothetical protein [Sphingomonas radiodurans]|uniref:hypothetical protein n=1 Tax=Sphingomonas radiodurans TaxID=2890321 RepID=UPI001E51AE27|nr:hypothetical protein [Sphingomonas radiodurans]WBH16731.1 hypothetical protein LLW23_00990 [Sphingomonas radiodurans]
MQFLKILFWALIAFVAAVFTFGNWKWVPIRLFGNLMAEVNLPVLLLVTFLAGVVPTYLYQRTIRWRLAQRLAAAERTTAALRDAAIQPVVEPEPVAPPPVAALIAVPPGVS